MSIFKNRRLRLNRETGGEGESEGNLLLEDAKPKTKKPSLYQVIMLNDDYTPMEFVIHILESLFSMNREKATQIMLQVHTKGKAVCGVYTRDIAETKAAQVIEYAKQNEHPLLCEIETVDG